MTEFQKILADYLPSEEAIASLQSSPLVFLTAPSGVGRNTLIRELEKTGKFKDLISDTTRPPRINDGILEQDGKEYFFVDEEHFLEGLRSGKYLEAAIIHNAQVSGIRIETFERIHSSGKIPISDIEIAGVDYYRRLKPDAICIFVLPPSFEVWMRRLKERGEMNEDEFRERMRSAKAELEHALSNDYHFLINDSITKATLDVQKLIERNNVGHKDSYIEQLAPSLLENINKILD